MGSPEYCGLQRLWKQLRCSPTWGRFVTAAKDGDLTTLETIGDLIQYPTEAEFSSSDDSSSDSLGGNDTHNSIDGEGLSSFVDLAEALPTT